MNKKYLILIIIPVVFFAIIGLLSFIKSQGGSGYQFEIVSHNGELGMDSYLDDDRNIHWIYNYTVYVKVRHNVGSQNTINITVELTRNDLTTIAKKQSVVIPVGQEEILMFFFSNDDLKGNPPIQYEIYGD